MSIAVGSMALGALLACSTPLQDGTETQAEELGRVRWERDHETAFRKAEESKRPVLLLFQEIPG